MIRVSDLSGREVILRKLLSFLILSIFAATILVLELIFYKYYVQHVDFPLWVYVRQIYAYFLSLWDFYLYGFNFDYLTFKEYLNSFCNSLFWGNRNDLLYTLFG